MESVSTAAMFPQLGLLHFICSCHSFFSFTYSKKHARTHTHRIVNHSTVENQPTHTYTQTHRHTHRTVIDTKGRRRGAALPQGHQDNITSVRLFKWIRKCPVIGLWMSVVIVTKLVCCLSSFTQFFSLNWHLFNNQRVKPATDLKLKPILSILYDLPC